MIYNIQIKLFINISSLASTRASVLIRIVIVTKTFQAGHHNSDDGGCNNQ